MKPFLLLVVVGLLVGAAFCGPATSPNPNPGPTPTPGGKLSVCIVEETADRPKLPADQLLSLTSVDVREYLNSHCDQENGTPTWRLFDKDQDVSLEPQEWQDELSVLSKGQTPVIAIKSGTLRSRWGKPQPLPKDTDSLLKLLKKYGGA